jgi:photosystem II stability/assembly factor-like uncharacterized protein
MRQFLLAAACLLISITLFGQQKANRNDQDTNSENIYKIKQQFLYNILHNPNDEDNDDDNDLARFNRWFNFVEPRCYPDGNLPHPDVLLRASQQASGLGNRRPAAKMTDGTSAWTPVGPLKVPINNNGIGRVNCIVIDPHDTGTLYVGTACGGVHISHDGGNTWTSNTDQFPSLSIADIAVNPHNSDTIYAATGDGYGYEGGGYNIFWGGLYTAGVMKSTDGGHTWDTTGLSYLQSNTDIIQKLLIHPNKPDILLAATRNGIFRTTDAGATWTKVDSGHVYSMAFRPQRPDTIYAVNTNDLRVSYNAGATWQTLFAGINSVHSRCTIGVSPATPDAVWILDANNDVRWSHHAGFAFTTTSRPDTAHFYGYYDRVFAVSPTDSNYLLAFGMLAGVSKTGGFSWGSLDPSHKIHVDFHAVAINPLNTSVIYAGSDGGIFVTRNDGSTWKNLSNGLMISQIYRIGVSQQNPDVMICGVQDNGTFNYYGTDWWHTTGGDGEACAIHPLNDLIQVSSWQNGHFYISNDQGVSFASLDITSETGSWTAPVALDPNTESTVYFGYRNIYATYDGGGSFVNLTGTSPFNNGATNIVVAPSNSSVIYASDLSKLLRSIDAGSTWINVTGSLPTGLAITRVAVDPRDPMRIFVTTSGYTNGKKVFMSTTGGTTWTNISANLPNLPADCIAIDTSTPGALFVGTDIGVYYTDSSTTGWSLYGTGLPNVIANDLNINYANYKVIVATYGRGVWECALVKPKPTVSAVGKLNKPAGAFVNIYPNPTTDNWKILFQVHKPADYSVKVTDVNGRLLRSLKNSDYIDATHLAPGIYNVEVNAGNETYNLKAIKE